MPLLLPKITITAADQAGRFRHYTLPSIYGIKLIGTQTTEYLQSALSDPVTHEELRQAIGSRVNERWVTLQVAEELCFHREALSVEHYDDLAR